MSSGQLPTIPASPNPLSEIEDYDDDDDDDSSDDGEQFERSSTGASHGRKRRHGDGASPLAQQKQQLDGQPERPFADSMYSSTIGSPSGALDGSMMSSGGPGGWGSWYFHPSQGSALGSHYGSMGQQYAAAYNTPGGTALPPHLAYWMHNPQNSVSDLTYQNQMSGGGGSMGGQMGGQLAHAAMMSPGGGGGDGRVASHPDLTHLLPPDDDEYKVYSSRWIMLAYMSMLNLLSDWTCYSVAPIAMLTVKAFGDVDPESLVTVFLGANALASALEPAILGRLGLRRTVLFGGFLLMMGSIVKSGGFKSIMMSTSTSAEEIMEEEEEDITWRLYLGFFLVGLSQPLYQCTPALLSASWFPENERTMATGVALNSNQLGIGCAFVFGTILVTTEEDIIPYFGLLSVIATITFIGTALQFDDAPPTPPSDTARVIRGDLEIKIPKLPFNIRGFGLGNNRQGSKLNLAEEGEEEELKGEAVAEAPAPAGGEENVEVTMAGIHDVEEEMMQSLVAAPSPAPTEEPVAESEMSHKKRKSGEGLPPPQPHPLQAQPNHPLQSPGAGASPSPPYPNPYPYIPPPGYYPTYPPPASPGVGYSTTAPSFYHGYDQQGHYHNALLETAEYDDDYAYFGADEGVEPIMTQLDHQLEIDIKDDQLIQQVKACFRRKGFSHCVVAFTTSGIIVNTLSTFMDYLVTLNGAGPEYVGIVGGTFQMLIMCASLVIGGWTDHSRKYYFVILAMLIAGAFALSICNVALDSDAGGDLRLTLLIVAVMAGPLQPISTELGVEVVYPLSENTVLVIQQLFSNLLSAAFIPVFKALRDVGTARDESEIKSMFEVPQYTFSFYLLIIIHAVSTCYFATFDGTYLRHEAELEKKAKKEELKAERLNDLQEQHRSGQGVVAGYGSVN
ncbi:hypothetical protein ACHAXR_009598 [Thalassiosira sp. AJA248-18]